MRILAFGDSITQGYWDSEGGWVARLRKHFDKEFLSRDGQDYVSVFNLGVDGDTTQGIVNRIGSETKAREWSGDTYTFIIATGANDTIFRGEESDSTPEAYSRSLENILAECNKYTRSVYFVGLTPVDDSKLHPMPWSASGKCYSTDRMKLFDEKLREFCAKNDAGYIDIWNIFDGQNLNELMYDGIHPNDEGHTLIAERVLKAISI